MQYARGIRMSNHIQSDFAIHKPACFSSHSDPQSSVQWKIRHIKASSVSFIFPSWNWFNACTHTHAPAPPFTVLSTYTEKERKERKTTAQSSKEPSQTQFCFFLLFL